MSKLLNRLKLNNDYIKKATGGLQGQHKRLVKTLKKASNSFEKLETDSEQDSMYGWLIRVINNPDCINDYGTGKITWDCIMPHVLNLDVYKITGYSPQQFWILFGELLDDFTIYERKKNKLENEFKKQRDEIDEEKAFKLKILYESRGAYFKKYLDDVDKYYQKGFKDKCKEEIDTIYRLKLQNDKEHNDNFEFILEEYHILSQALIKDNSIKTKKLLEELDQALFEKHHELTEVNKKTLLNIYKKNGVKI